MFASSHSKKRRSRIRPYLITSASPARSSRSRQGRERVGVGQHRQRLVKRADHVLAARVVDGGLSADRGIHLRQQRRGHLDEGHAALVGRRGKAGEVADDAAAQRDQRGLAVAARLEQPS